MCQPQTSKKKFTKTPVLGFTTLGTDIRKYSFTYRVNIWNSLHNYVVDVLHYVDNYLSLHKF